MKKVHIDFQLPVSFLKEDKRFIAYTLVLDLSTSGKTYEEARKRFEEVARLFFEETLRKGTLDEALQELGWQKREAKWQPPVVVSNEPIREQRGQRAKGEQRGQESKGEQRGQVPFSWEYATLHECRALLV